jgi:phosphotriesterase-related protein
VFLGIDNIGYKGDGYPADEVRARNIAELIHEGFEDQILLSLDICMKQHLHSYGGKGYDHLQMKFLPLLAGLGIDQAKITKMTITNPAHALAFAPREENPKER